MSGQATMGKLSPTMGTSGGAAGCIPWCTANPLRAAAPAGDIRDTAIRAFPAFDHAGLGQRREGRTGLRERAIDALTHLGRRMLHPRLLKERLQHLLGGRTKRAIHQRRLLLCSIKWGWDRRSLPRCQHARQAHSTRTSAGGSSAKDR